MIQSGEEFFLKIYSVNDSVRLVIYDFRISHAGWIRIRRRIQYPEKRLAGRTPGRGRMPAGNGAIFRPQIRHDNKDINQSRLIKRARSMINGAAEAVCVAREIKPGTKR